MAEQGSSAILEQLIDRHYLEVPFANAQHIVDGRVPLPQLPTFEVFGVPIDMSITRHVVMLWIAGASLVTVMLVAFRRPQTIPRGLASFLEPIVLYVRDEVVLANMGERGRAYLPFLLTVFFFVLFCNLVGLMPYSATPTGNINVTAALALCTFLVIVGAGILNHGLLGFFAGLVPSGTPCWLLPVMLIVELVGLLAKPFALCIRLFANMTAGHAVILALISMIFVFRSAAVGLLAVPFAAFIYLLEIFVALVQAFIFTLLSALFIGMAAHSEH